MILKRYGRNGVRAPINGEYVLYEDYKKILSEEKDLSRGLREEVRRLQRENNYLKRIVQLTDDNRVLLNRVKSLEGSDNG